MASFNLIDEPWIPCLMAPDGARRYLGLRQTLRLASGIREVSDQSPLVTAAVYRLLLAILHRSLDGPKDEDDWSRLWGSGLRIPDLDAYLTRWHSRFDLFDDERPFCQTAGLPNESAVPVSKIAHELASGNNDTLFDHTTDDAGVAFEPGVAARRLLSWLAFAPGGLQSTDKRQGKDSGRSADGAPLVKGAMALVRGEDLFQTLMLNLHCYDQARGEPFPRRGDDRPIWERDEEIRPEDRLPDGYLDLLTWPSRRVKLLPEEDEGGRIVVRRAVILKGNQFPDGYSARAHETMLAFKKILKPGPGQDPWPAVGFREDRAIWRDSLAFLQLVEGEQERPKTMGWLGDLCDAGTLDRSATLPLDLYGLCTDRAKVLFWRHERLPVPLAYLHDKPLVDSLRIALDMAERTANALGPAKGSSAWELARLIVAPESDNPGGRQPKDDVVRPLASSFGASARFWARLELQFRRLLVELPGDKTTDGDGETVEYGGAFVLPGWAESLRRAAIQSFGETASGLDTSSRTIKATAKAEATLRAGLRKVLGKYLDRAQMEVKA